MTISVDFQTRKLLVNQKNIWESRSYGQGLGTPQAPGGLEGVIPGLHGLLLEYMGFAEAAP